MTSLRRSLPAVAVLVALLALAGCGSDSSSSASATTDTTADVETATQEGTTTGEGTTTAEEETSTTEAGGGAGAASQVKTITVTVVGARPEGGIVRESVKKGDKVALVVTSDVADEIHLHGYDIMKDVAAGGTTRITFVASVPGRFEAELESRGVQIADVTVNP